MSSGLLASLAAPQLPSSGLLTLVIGIAALTLMLKTPKTIAKWCRVGYSFKTFKNLGSDLAAGLSQSLEQARAVRLANAAAEADKEGEYA